MSRAAGPVSRDPGIPELGSRLTRLRFFNIIAFAGSARLIKAGFYQKAVLTSLNMACVPISRSRFKQRQILAFRSLTNVLRFCVKFWVIFGHFGKERYFFLEGWVELRKISVKYRRFDEFGKLKFEVKN